ncbi:MAG TPA: family 1 glycosylhydrolase, partial [Candidatus Saccharimonadales bacterium]|nr:family 1 glycosylhydrolase [Candidatus Saccharimonadales bacterium]
MLNRQETGFPKKFLWGVSSNAHQVEGGQSNQWTVWELENAKALAAQAPYHYDDLDSWEGYEALATQPPNYVSGVAVDHYELYERDLDLVRKMNMNAYRLSIEWSRIQPQKDAW